MQGDPVGASSPGLAGHVDLAARERSASGVSLAGCTDPVGKVPAERVEERGDAAGVWGGQRRCFGHPAGLLR